MELPADVLRNGHAIRLRASYLDVPRLSDITPDMGTIRHGNIYLGNTDARHIGMSEEGRSFYANDEHGRTYWRVSYQTDYFRLGLRTEPGISWSPETGVQVDGDAIADHSIPAGKFDLGERLNHFLDTGFLRCGQWVVGEDGIVGYDEGMTLPRIMLDSDASIRVLTNDEQAYLRIAEGEARFVSWQMSIMNNPHATFSMPINTEPPYEYGDIYVGQEDPLVLLLLSNMAGYAPQIQLLDANRAGGMYGGNGMRIQDINRNMQAQWEVSTSSPVASQFSLSVTDDTSGTGYTFFVTSTPSTHEVVDAYHPNYYHRTERTDGTVLQTIDLGNMTHFPKGISTALSLRLAYQHIQSDGITVDQGMGLLLLTPESGTSDTLSNISGGYDGQVILLRPADSSYTVSVTSTGNIHVPSTRTLSGQQNTLTLLRVSSNDWYEVSYA